MPLVPKPKAFLPARATCSPIVDAIFTLALQIVSITINSLTMIGSWVSLYGSSSDGILYTDQFHTINITDPAAPVIADTHSMGDLMSSGSIEYVDSYIFYPITSLDRLTENVMILKVDEQGKISEHGSFPNMISFRSQVQSLMMGSKLARANCCKLEVIELSNIDAPVKLSELDLAINVVDFTLVGNYGLANVYSLGTGKNELRILNLPQGSDQPFVDDLNPVGTLRLDTSDELEVSQNGTLLYVYSSSKLTIFDFSDPMNLQQKGSLDLTSYGYCGPWNTRFMGSTMFCLTQTGPGIPNKKSSNGTGDDTDGQTPGKGDDPSTTYFTIIAFDLSKPESPRKAGELQIDATGLYNPKIAGNIMYFTEIEWLCTTDPCEAASHYSLVRVDISNVDELKLLEKVNVPGEVFHMHSNGKVVCTLNHVNKGTGTEEKWVDVISVLRIYKELAYSQEDLELDGAVTAISAEDEKIYVTLASYWYDQPVNQESWKPNFWLRLYGVKQSPDIQGSWLTRLSEIKTGGQSWNIQRIGNTLFVAMGWGGGFQVFNISKPEKIAFVSFIPTLSG